MTGSLKEKTAHGLFWGSISQGLQQFLNLLFGIFLARLLTPGDYGMIGMLALFSAIASNLQESGFVSALAIRQNPQSKDYNAVFWFNIFTGISVYIILFFCAPLIARFYDTPELTSLARYQFLGFMIASFGTAQSSVLFKNLMVKQRAIASVSAMVVSGTCGVILAWLGYSYWGLATQSIVYVTVIVAMNWYFSPWRPTFDIDLRPLKEMFGFSSRLLLTNIFLQFNNYLFSVILGRFYKASMVGYFSQANKWSTMGYSLIGGILSSVAQPVLAEVALDSDRQVQVFRKMLRFTAFLSFPALFGLALVANELILITITDKWAFTIPILQILCIWGAFYPVSQMCTNLIISRGHSRIYMYGTMALGITQLLIVFITFRYGILPMIVVFAGVNICWLFVWQFFLYKLVRLRLWELLRDILPFAVISGIVMFAAYWITSPVSNIYLLFIAKIAVAAILYVWLLWWSDARIFRESVQFLVKKWK